MKLAIAILSASLALGLTSAFANPKAPTNGGSANGGGSSGQCTGAQVDRPASCHNGNGAGN